MNRTSWIKHSVLAVVVAVGLAAPVSAATPDAWITAKTKLSLLTTEGVSGTAIHVDTILGKVTLHGKVPSAEEKAKAESIARKIDGVLEVRNLLQVVTPESKKAVQLSDDALKQRVEKALQGDASLEESSISVKSVNKHAVLLSGTAKTLSAHLRAVETVAWVPGVERVASEIKSPDAVGKRKFTIDPATTRHYIERFVSPAPKTVTLDTQKTVEDFYEEMWKEDQEEQARKSKNQLTDSGDRMLDDQPPDEKGHETLRLPRSPKHYAGVFRHPSFLPFAGAGCMAFLLWLGHCASHHEPSNPYWSR